MNDLPKADGDRDAMPASDHVAKHAEALGRLDLNRLWSLCGGIGVVSTSFGKQLDTILSRYNPEQRPPTILPAKQRDKIYQRLEKAALVVIDELNELPHQIWYELQDTFTLNEPPDVDEILSGENEGLTYGEYQTDRMTETLTLLLATVQDARTNHKRNVGRPKQNENLETVIHDLGDLYEFVSSDRPMKSYRYNEADAESPYQGAFLNFLCATLWAYNDRTFPTNNALGEATRVAFNLRK